MPKVLVFGTHDKLGGIENYMHNLVMFKDTDDVHFDFAVSFPTSVFEDEYAEMGIKTYHLPSFKKHPFAYLNQAKAIITNNGYDAVYYNMMSAANILPLVAGAKTNLKTVIAHAHNNGSPGFVRTAMNAMNRGLARKYSTHLWSNSLESAEWMFGTTKDVKIIQNAVDTYKFEFNPEVRAEVLQELGLEGNYIVGNIGRFEEQKNHVFLIEVFKELAQKNDSAVLVLAGAGPLEPQVKELVASYGLQDRVKFLGVRRDVERLMQAFDVFVLPSLFDGLPLVMLEAQAAGLPCVTSTAVPEAVAILDIVKRISLEETLSVWADEILQSKTEDRLESCKIIQKSKIEIRNQAPKIAAEFKA